MRRFTKGKIAARKALYSLKMVRTKMPKVDITAVKKIGSAKNGCEHKMLVKKNNSYLPTKSLVHKRSGNRCFRNHKRNIRNCSRSVKRDHNYVIATTAHVDLRKVNIPKHIKDGYFRRARKKTIHTEKDIFKRYVPSEQRKADQKTVGKEVLEAIKVHPEARGIRRYLKTMYSLPSLCAAPV
ncbi:hypothetical protein pipiens_006440 [Culex pipiens pipiens]|uniref:60S ribosomal protein L6 n=1 Tax=Culex pipiens pipiens TaxID=38569 RepID=A0ABD1DPS6_CULPP